MKTIDDKLYFDKSSFSNNSEFSREIVFSLSNINKVLPKESINSQGNQIYYEGSNTKMITETASAGRRFLNYIIDLLSFYIFSYIIGIYLGICSAIFGFDISWLEKMGVGGNYLFGFVLMMIFYTFFEGFFAITPGKLLTGTKVVTENGEKPKFVNILGRTLCRFIPFDAFSFLGDSAIGWHDSISNTRVVKKKKFNLIKIRLSRL